MSVEVMSVTPVKFSQAAWYTIKLFAGIYNNKQYVDMLREINSHKMNNKELYTLLHVKCNLPPITENINLHITLKYDYSGNINYNHQIKKKISKNIWRKRLLQHVAEHKSEQLYQNMSKHMSNYRFKCICGENVRNCNTIHQFSNKHRNKIFELSDQERAAKLHELYQDLTTRKAVFMTGCYNLKSVSIRNEYYQCMHRNGYMHNGFPYFH